MASVPLPQQAVRHLMWVWLLLAGATTIRASARILRDGGVETNSSFLTVTGYWRLDHKDADNGNLRSGPGGYLKNMPWVMTLGSPMVIWGDSFGIKHMSAARGNATPPLVAAREVAFESLPPCVDHGKLLRKDPSMWTHPKDCPSISLGCVWDGKVRVLANTAREFPGYTWYGWVDVGMHAAAPYAGIFRKHNQQAWPHPSKLAKLPTDKISVSHSGMNCDRMYNKPFQFWHCVAATAFVVPASIMFEVEKLFYQKLDECIDYWSLTGKMQQGDGEWGGFGCLSEQMLMSLMARDRPDLFNWIGHGWGAIAANLTAEFHELAYGGTSDLVGWLSTGDDEEVQVAQVSPSVPRRLR